MDLFVDNSECVEGEYWDTPDSLPYHHCINFHVSSSELRIKGAFNMSNRQ